MQHKYKRMKKSEKYFGYVMIVLLVTGCSLKEPDPTIAGIYSPGTINTSMSERDAALSPDSSAFYFSVQLTRQQSVICYATKFNGKWMRPMVAPFSGEYTDIEPVFHPDGRLFFVSNRPTMKDDSIKDFNIWYVQPGDLGWSDPQPLGAAVNSGGNEFYPSFTANGDLYFTATLPGGKGAEDLWVSKYENENYLQPENLGDSINTSDFEYNGFINREGTFILFTTHGRGKGYGSADLYVSFRKKDGGWGQPKNMGEKVNTAGFEFCPSLSPDEKTLFFTRRNIPAPEGKKWGYFEMMSSFNSLENGQGNIYKIDAAFIQKLK